MRRPRVIGDRSRRRPEVWAKTSTRSRRRRQAVQHNRRLSPSEAFPNALRGVNIDGRIPRGFRSCQSRRPARVFSQRLRWAALAVDSWLDHAVYVSIQAVRAGLEGLYVFSNRVPRHGVAPGRRRARLRRPDPRRRPAAILALALAIPAFHETGDDWLQQRDFAVTFLDRYGNEIGQRGIRHDDSVPLDEMPDHLDQGRARHRGPPLLRALRHRLHRHVPRRRGQRPRRTASCRAAPRITQQLAKNLFLSNERTLERKIKEAFSRSGSSAT